jgi:hypothetical protein
MIGVSGQILKSKDVVFEGQCYLDPARIMAVKAKKQKGDTLADPTRVCILENHPKYAIVEVTCTCGLRMCFRCEYASAKTTNNLQAQNSATAEAD